MFVLLLQQKVQQMEDSKRSTENEKEVQILVPVTSWLINICSSQRLCLLDQIVALQRERERLSHTLTDRTAELQLEISKTQVGTLVLCTHAIQVHTTQKYIKFDRIVVHLFLEYMYVALLTTP